MADEAVFPIRYPTDTSGIKQGISELDRLRAALQEDQKQIAGLQKAAASLKLDPDVKGYLKQQDELKKLVAAEENASKKFKELTAQRDKLVSDGADDKKIAEAEKKRTEAYEASKKAKERIAGQNKAIAESEKKTAVKQYNDVNTALKHNEAQLASNQSKYLALGGDMTKVGEKAKGDFDKLSEGADLAGGSIGGMKQKFEALKALGPAGVIAAIVVTIVALGIALAKTTWDLTKFAIEAGDAARSMGIMMEAAAGSSAGGKELGAMVGRLRKDFAGSREEIAGMVLELRRSGLAGKDLERTVRLAGIESKTMGDAASGILKGLIERGHLTKRFTLNPFDLRGTGLEFKQVAAELAKLTGHTVGTVKAALLNGQVKLTDGIAALEASVKNKFGDLAKRQLLALPEQINRARENMKAIFAGVNVDKFLESFAKVTDLLDESTTTGQTLRKLAKDIFQPIINFASDSALPLIRTFFIGASVAILDVVNTSLKAYIWFKKTFGDVSLFKGVDGAALAFKAGKAAVYLFIGGVIVLTAVFGTLATLLAQILAPIWQLPAAITAAVASIGAIKDKVKSMLGAGSDGAKDAGNDTAKGVAVGIKDGQPVVNAAMKDLAKGGKEAFEAEMKIASPSKEMRASAKWIGPGVAQGVDDGRGVVERAMSRLVDPQDAMPAPIATTTGASNSRPIMVNIDKVIIGGDGKISAPSKTSLMEQAVELIEDIRRQLAMVQQ